MPHSFHIYIDESGDDGLAKFRVPRQPGGGSSHWLVIGACVVRASRDLELVAIRDQIRSECTPSTKQRDIHFKKFGHNQKRHACNILSGSPIRFSCVLGLKNTPSAAAFRDKNQSYFYLTRYLIERTSWLCRDYRHIVKEGDGRAKITFSRRGGMNYETFQNYLTHLRDRDDTTVHWPAIDIDAVSTQDHSRMAALQLADFGTSAIAAAIEPDAFGNVEPSYMQALKNNIYNRKGNFLSYGLKFLPEFSSAGLSKDQAAAFQTFR